MATCQLSTPSWWGYLGWLAVWGQGVSSKSPVKAVEARILTSDSEVPAFAGTTKREVGRLVTTIGRLPLEEAAYILGGKD